VGTETAVLVIAGAIFLIASVSNRLSKIWLTEPLVAVLVGVGVGAFLDAPLDLSDPLILTSLELILALVLFGDAARIDLRNLRHDYVWPVRMLLIGLPLAMAGGAAVSAWLLTVPVGVGLLIGVVLAPTDAALAEPVLESKTLPARVRQTINVESGLNDGLAIPALFVAIGIVEAEMFSAGGEGLVLFIEQIGIGGLGGLAFGAIGAFVIGRGSMRGWMRPIHQKIAALALALTAFASVQLLGGSGFVATFVAGALLAARIRPRCEYLYEFADTEGRALVLVAFLLLGAGPVSSLLLTGAEPEVWAVALVSLLIVRPLAILVSLTRQNLMLSTSLFLGWFGPRGLATLVFMLVAIEELGEAPEFLTEVVILTVALSVILHGLTATPLSRWLGRRIESQADMRMPEMGEAFDHPTRTLSPPSPGLSGES
jgi:NhaP-type Na+/H+ or K+/H+ antiporter